MRELGVEIKDSRTQRGRERIDKKGKDKGEEEKTMDKNEREKMRR